MSVRTEPDLSSTPRKDSRDEEEPHNSSSSSCCVVRRQLPSPTTSSSGCMTDTLSPPIASCRAETILLSSASDVLSTRCRHGPYAASCLENTNTNSSSSAYQWNQAKDDMAVLCCENDCDDLSTQLQQSGAGGVCTGLLGGAPTAAAAVAPLHSSTTSATEHQQIIYDTTPKNNTTTTRAQKAFRSQALESFHGGDTEEDSSSSGMILPIRSFDYSQFYEGGNAMVPNKSNTNGIGGDAEEEAEKENLQQSTKSPFVHGVPTFLPSFTNIKITTVSAHPLGNHVLLISNAGLLYSYGLNDHGQLGIGMKTPTTSSIHRGYVLQPTIVTPLVENGGKAIRIAAGTNHSLVVVETEERRLFKSQSFDHPTTAAAEATSTRPQRAVRSQSECSTEAVVHHQMYGFGCNDFMKIGLVRKVAGNCVVLPRRVALRCSVRPSYNEGWDNNNHNSDQPQQPQGIFAVEASAEHSAALVRKANGDVELYTWGNAMYNCLGLPKSPPSVRAAADAPGLEQAPPPVRVVPVPSFVASLSRTSNPDAQSSSMLLYDQGEHPVDISLGRRCSFVVTSIGRCFSFGVSEEGMLGLGRTVLEADQPTEIAMPQDARQEAIVSVSAGGGHVIACTKSGNAYGWGARCHAGIEIPFADEAKSKKKSSPKENDAAVQIEWSPKRIVIPETSSNSRHLIVQACAGFDCSFFVVESGSVYSTGKNSGRLGVGEVSQEIVNPPKPLFGGLHLWRKKEKNQNSSSEPLSVKKPQRARLNRGITMC